MRSENEVMVMCCEFEALMIYAMATTLKVWNWDQRLCFSCLIGLFLGD